MSVAGGTGISVSSTTGNTTITNTGLTGLTSANAGSNITITGSATNPTISATAGSAGTQTTNPIPFYSSVAVASPLGTSQPVPSSTVSVNPSEYWLVSVQYSIQSTVNDASNIMNLFMQFSGGGQVWELFSAPESTEPVYGTATAIIKIPASKTSMTMYVGGGVGGTAGTLNATILSLIYSKLSLV